MHRDAKVSMHKNLYLTLKSTVKIPKTLHLTLKSTDMVLSKGAVELEARQTQDVKIKMKVHEVVNRPRLLTAQSDKIKGPSQHPFWLVRRNHKQERRQAPRNKSRKRRMNFSGS